MKRNRFSLGLTVREGDMAGQPSQRAGMRGRLWRLLLPPPLPRGCQKCLSEPFQARAMGLGLRAARTNRAVHPSARSNLLWNKGDIQSNCVKNTSRKVITLQSSSTLSVALDQFKILYTRGNCDTA